MILYLDTSALVKVYFTETDSEQISALLAQAETAASHVIAYVETRAALARLHREEFFDEQQFGEIKIEFSADWENYLQVETSFELLNRASELAELFALRAYDSVHLAAAESLAVQSGKKLLFACFDRKLNQAAASLGLETFPVNLE